MRAFVSARLLALSLVLAGCGAAPPEAPAVATPAGHGVDVAKGGAKKESAAPPALGELSLRVPPGQSLAYRIKTRTEQPGRKVETDSILFLDAWGDGTIVTVVKNGEHEHSADRERNEYLPLPEGAQSTYEKVRALGRRGPPGASKEDDKATERFDRRRLPAGGEEIAYHLEQKRAHSEEAIDALGTFDVSAMRYERIHLTRVRRQDRPGNKPLPPAMREMRVETDVAFDAALAEERTKQRAARREITLRAAQDPAGTANPTADLASMLSGQMQDTGTLDFLVHGKPELVWRAALSAQSTQSAMQKLSFTRVPVPDGVLADVKAAIRKSPNHPVAVLVVGARDRRLLPELEAIAKKHEDSDVRDAAVEAQKEIKRRSTPLAARLRTIKPGNRTGAFESLMVDVDPDRDRTALFEYVLAQLPTAGEDERMMYVSALEALAIVSLGSEVEPWKQFWSTHKDKPYDEWLVEALASDAPVWVRANAAERMGERPPSDTSRKALRAALDDKAPEIRLQAAQSLATMKDDAAIRPLLRGLLDDGFRYPSLLALANFSDTDFGLAITPGTQTPEETAAALGRWLGWAKRRGIEPGFP